MRRPNLLLALALLAGPVAAQDVGSTLPPVEIDGIQNSKATRFDDFLGRAVLLEFFAHW